MKMRRRVFPYNRIQVFLMEKYNLPVAIRFHFGRN